MSDIETKIFFYLWAHIKTDLIIYKERKKRKKNKVNQSQEHNIIKFSYLKKKLSSSYFFIYYR